MKTNSATSIVALGGLGEVGKNMYVITHEDEIIIIDAVLHFSYWNLKTQRECLIQLQTCLNLLFCVCGTSMILHTFQLLHQFPDQMYHL